MKLTYRCMFDDHLPPEAELAQWQNFDQLLSQYHQAKQARTKVRRWGYGAIVLAVVLGGSGVYYFYNSLRPSDLVTRVIPLSPQLLDAEISANNRLPSVEVKPVPLPEKKAAAPPRALFSEESPANQVENSQFVEAQPASGYPALYDYFAAELQYPEAARQEKVEGTVLMEFYIDEEGKPDRIRVLQGVREDINQEAIRLIQSMPKWLPARVNDQAVATKHTMPLHFQLDDEF